MCRMNEKDKRTIGVGEAYQQYGETREESLLEYCQDFLARIHDSNISYGKLPQGSEQIVFYRS
jgi:hypothetical protein